MDKEQGIRIIRDIFENPFDYEKYSGFSNNLLKHIEATPTTIQAGSRIPDAFKSHIRLMKRVGKYKDPQGNTIDILAVWLKKGTSLERARTMQRNYIARYLDGSRGGNQKNAALTAFISPDENDWRFSFIKMEYELGQTTSGKLKGVEKFTAAKRYSFIVGSNESSHTAQSQLLDILCKDADPSLAEIENAFSIERVTKEFFRQYHELFGNLKKSLEDIAAKDEKIRENFAAQGVIIDDFAKKTLGQIVFLYFLQKKGWFGVERDAKWGTGHKNFLRRLFSGEIKKYGNFFNDILEPLFYEALSKKRDDDFYQLFNCKIPFLNGGLFDPINDYDWVHTDIIIPNEIFSNSEKTKEEDKGTGILDVFDRYNFTVKEDEPLEKDVAVDPEMLGKVFENLLESKERKSKGSFYTPREIVHYMCQESLINYLDNELSGAVHREDLELLVRKGEAIIENEYAVLARENKINTGLQKGTKIKTKIPQSVRENAKALDNALEKIRVCDPAVGSGAFLVGMMNEIVKARRALAPVFEKISAGQRVQERVELVYKLKRHAIQNCLYGVDIDPGAVEIAKLRLWLSLVVDEEEYKTIQPLPNLNYKIMQGNSLLEEYEGVKLFDERMIEPVQNIEDKKNQLLKQLNNFESELKQLSAGGLTSIKSASKKNLYSKCNEVRKAIEKIQNSGEDFNLDISFDGINQARKKAEQLRALHKEFFEAYQRDDKKRLKEQIENIEWDLIEATLKEQNKTKELDKLKKLRKENIKPYFLWKLNFEEVFREKGGFDIVIANPPYVRADSPSIKLQRECIKKCKRYETLWEKWDLYVAFIERGFQILRKNAVLEFIIPDAYMTSKYAEKSHKYFLENAKINRINFCSELKIFEAAVRNILIEYEKEINPNHIPLRIKHIDEWNNFIFLRSKRQSEMGKNTFKLDSENKTIGDLSNTLTWSEICYVSKGMVLNADEKQYKAEFQKIDLISEAKDKIHSKPYIEAKWTQKYAIEKIKYLEWGTDRVPKRISRPTFP
ncbi:MAG: hypothetical protein COT16_03350, partial [Elusimicrobia bacterium CG08_land_8_20_14_0_20_44_26]